MGIFAVSGVILGAAGSMLLWSAAKERPARPSVATAVRPWRPLEGRERLALSGAVVVAALLPVVAGSYWSRQPPSASTFMAATRALTRM